MFVVYIGSLLTTGLYLQALGAHGEAPAGFILAVTVWLWFTVLFANFAEAVAEGRSKAQAAALRGAKRDTMAKKLDAPRKGAAWSPVASATLRKGDVFLVESGDFIPALGELIKVLDRDGKTAPLLTASRRRSSARPAAISAR
jgi:K+-transporting ATPase ATPase B chain